MRLRASFLTRVAVTNEVSGSDNTPPTYDAKDVVDRTVSSLTGRVGVLLARARKHPPASAVVQNEQDCSASREAALE